MDPRCRMCGQIAEYKADIGTRATIGAFYCGAHAPSYARRINPHLAFLRVGVTFTEEQKERIRQHVSHRIESGDLTPIVTLPPADGLEE
jgi:hypothetical protein